MGLVLTYKTPQHWEFKKIGNYTEIITDYVANGSFASLKENVTYVDCSDYVLIRLVDYNNNFNGDFKYITESSYEYLSKTKLFGGEIIISNVGANAGTVFKAPDLGKKMSLGPNSITLRTKGIDDFYYYWFKSSYGQHALDSIITGSAQPKFNKTNFRDIVIPVPPLSEQKLIADTIKIFDSKIENNNAIIANLEEQAQAIFKSWFVDFEPFQEEAFVSSELGNIPSFWQVVEANDWFKINIGKTPPRKQSEWFSTNPNDIKWLSISDMKNIQTFANKTSEYLTNEAVDKFNVRIAPANSVLLSFKLTIGRVAITRDELTTNEAIAHFHTNKHMELYYLYIYLNTFNYNKLGNTSSIGNAVNSKIIKAMPILKPNDKTLMKFHTVIEPLFNMIYEKVKENEKLETIRDILLPHLMSGEIRVEDTIEVKEM